MIPTPPPETAHHLVPTRLGDEVIVSSAVATEHIEANGRPVTGLGAGDSRYDPALLSSEEAAEMFASLSPGGEVPYQQWYHMPDPKRPQRALRPLRRIKAAMALHADAEGFVAHYRFPVNDQCRYGVITPMTPTVDALRRKVEAATGERFNHAVVLCYRDGQDSIGFHKDKMLDLDPEAPIVCISLGAARPFVLQDDIASPTRIQQITLASGSMIAIGPKTNMAMYHAIPAFEGAEIGPRISITFRRAATFRTADGRLRGQGAGYSELNWPSALRGAHRLDETLDQPLEARTPPDDRAP